MTELIKVLKIALSALVTLALIGLVVVLPSLGGRSLGMVGAWIWKACWTLLGVVGATAVLFMGGAYALFLFWKRGKRAKTLSA